MYGACCEGTVRNPVGWVQDCDFVICYGLCELHAV